MPDSNELRPVCGIHEENTTLLARVDSKLGTLISLLSVAIVLWFPVVVSGTVFVFSLSSRLSNVEEQISLIKAQRNMDHPRKDRML